MPRGRVGSRWYCIVYGVMFVTKRPFLLFDFARPDITDTKLGVVGCDGFYFAFCVSLFGYSEKMPQTFFSQCVSGP
ncbi:hypothetical protein Tcan_09795 [Toxocara canis]|uniref:Uncharacterized protein n=1 Tax=Toxocara canis TaxID=6265 RepID=A0A0B2VXC0_TOXCA|nr:hypothetical protein Tcan_09795 [Toxocara canis]